MKKMISSLLAMAMTAMSLTVVASAADVTVKVGSQEVDASNKNFSVDVSLAGVPSSGINTVDFAISYDASFLKISDVKLGSIGDTGAASKEGELGDTVFSWYDTGSQIVVVWSTGLTDSANWIKSDGTFLTLSGSVSASSGSSELKIVPASRESYPSSGKNNADVVFANVDGDSYGYSATNGKISFKEATTTTTTTTTSTTPTPGKVLYGDANCDGSVTVSDAIIACRAANSDTTLSISSQGKTNADCDGDNALTAKDASIILKLVAKLLTQADMPMK